MLWGLTALGGAWGWIICNFVWKVPGQEDDPWFSAQLKQAMVVGGIAWVGYPFCGLGWLLQVGLGVLGFLTIGKGLDYRAPVLGGLLTSTPEEEEEEYEPERPQPVSQAQPQQSAPPASALDPIEGVSLQVWAWAQAHIDLGHPHTSILGQVQIDPERWKRVTAQWLVRRATDRTGAVQAEYEKYRPAQAQPAQVQPAQAQPARVEPARVQVQPVQAQPARVEPARVQVQPAQAQPVRVAQPAQAQPASTEPIALERWVEVSVALEVGQQRGWDCGQLMANFGLAPSEWAMAHAWWSQAYGMRSQDPNFIARFQQLQQYYRQYYQGR
jgi:hypothetical protein